jgi:hypothetical protein
MTERTRRTTNEATPDESQGDSRARGGELMTKFYHFTQYKHLERICEEGIRPLPQDERNYPHCDDDVFGGTVVWLTTTDENPHAYWSAVCDVRITLELPKSRRLFHWATWLKRHYPEVLETLDSDHGDGDWRSFYFFRGTISPDTFTAVDCIDCGDGMGKLFHETWHDRINHLWEE